jgi:integrase
MLKEIQIMAAKPAEKRYRLKDAQGLFVEVMPTGRKFFRVEFRLKGRLTKETIGPYPDVKLADARLRVAEIRTELRAGHAPSKIRPASFTPLDAEAAEKVSQRWETVAEEFIEKRIEEGLALTTKRQMKKNIRRTYPELGDLDIAKIKGVDLLPILRRFEEAGKFETVRDIRCRMSQVFRYGVATGRTEHDPAHMIRDALIKRKPGKRPGLTDAKDVGGLLRAIRGYEGEASTRGALLLSAHTALRSTELRGAKWAEIDFDARLWTVPKDRMKMRYGRHLVPLSTQALGILEWLRSWNSGKLVFPAARTPGCWLSPKTANAALRRMGYDTKTQHCQHGFRTTFSTNLNEMGWNRDWIEKQLSHYDRNGIRSAYNAAIYMEGRTEMMQAWSDWLEKQEQKV